MILFFIFLFFVFSLFFCRNLYFSLLFLSFLTASTDLGNLSVIFIWVLMIIGLFNRKIKFNRDNFIVFLCFFIIIFILIFLSLFFNGAYLYNSVGTISKITPIILFLFMSYNVIFFSEKDVYININIFIFLSVLCFILYPIGYYKDVGVLLPRYSSFLYDSNYFALFCFIFFVFMDCYKSNFSRRGVFYSKLLLFLFIILSQSFSILLFLITYIIFNKRILFLFSRIINPYFYFFMILFILYFLSSFEPLGFYEDWEDSYISFKLNSAIIRLNGIYYGFVYIKDNFLLFMFGMGSGRTLEVYDRVFHNLYFQELFDHGILYYFCISIVLFKSIKNRFNNNGFNIIILYLFLNNLFFDNFYSFIFVFSFLIFSLKNNNSLN